MRYLHTLSMMASTPWALEYGFLMAAKGILMSRSLGETMGQPETEAKLSQRREREAARSDGAVAVLPIYGVMDQRMSAMDEACAGGVSVERVSAQFKALIENDDVSAIVLDWDSPGGSTSGVQELAAQIREARGTKPIISQVNSLMASAAYWAGSAADEIVVTPGGRAGSIGVYSVHEDISAMLEQKGIKATILKEGANKVEVNPFGPLSKEGSDQVMTLVKEAASAFRGDVGANRKRTKAQVIEQFGDGKVFGAKELVDRGMADRIGTLGDTLARLGVPSKGKSAAAQASATFANGDIPAISVLNDALRTVGMSKSQADALLLRGFGGLLPGASEAAEPLLNTEARSQIAALRAAIARG